MLPDSGYPQAAQTALSHTPTATNSASFSADKLWLSSLRSAGRSPKTISTYSYAIEQFRAWRDELPNSDRDLLSVNRFEVMAFTSHLGELYTAAGNANRVRCLRAFYSWALSEQMITTNPFGRLRMSVLAQAKPVPSSEDVNAMIDRARRGANPQRDVAVLRVLIATGARKGEVAAITMADLQLDSGCIWLNTSKTRRRLVPLDGEAITAIGKWLRKRGVGHGGLWSSADPYALMDAICRRTSGGQWRPHALRRYMIVNALRSGISPMSLSRLVGHSDLTMINRHYLGDAADSLALQEYRRIYG